MRLARIVVALLVSLSAYAAAERPVLIRNAALVLTMDPALGSGPLGLIENGDVLFDRTGILAVGRGLSAEGADVHDGTNRIVMPGFVDTHNHLQQSGIRGCGTDHNVIGWSPQCSRTLNTTVTLTEGESYTLVRLSTLGVIETGVTTVVDSSAPSTLDSLHGQLRAQTDSGLRFVYVYRATRTGRAAEIRRVKREWIDPNPLATLQVGAQPNADDLSWSVPIARELGLMLHIHVYEALGQRQERQFEALAAAGALAPNLIMAHAIHLTDDEIAAMAAKGVRVAHNPLSNMRLASGIIRFPELRDAGIRVGLGLDGGTNDTADMFNNMRAATGLQRVKHLSATAYPNVNDVLRMATIGGAEVLGMSDRIGSLTPGKQADLIVIDPSGINFAPRINWLPQIVFNGQPRNVEWVWVAGRPLKANGKLVGVNEKEIVAAAEEVANKIRPAIP